MTPLGATTRADDLDQFYQILSNAHSQWPVFPLADLSRVARVQKRIPNYGVYFVFEDGERRQSPHGRTGRVVRVGTHGSPRPIVKRLWDHHGPGRSSFRNALALTSVGLHYPQNVLHTMLPDAHWAWDDTDDRIRRMRFLCIPVKANERHDIETNATKLLSNRDVPSIDPPSDNWFGLASPEATIRDSGQWSRHHTRGEHDPEFLTILEDIVDEHS